MEKDKTMVRTRKNKDNPYVMLDKTGLNDPRLSWKAKGLHAYLMSLPDDWTIYIGELTNHTKDGRDSTRAAFKELELAGYITNEAIRNKKGHITKWEKIVYEQPLHWDQFEMPKRKKKEEKTLDTENPFLDEKPDTDNPDLDNPDLDYPTLLINNSTDKKLKPNNKNNNNKKVSKRQKPDQKEDVPLKNTLPVVVDLLNKSEIKVNQTTLSKWYKLADEGTIVTVIQEAFKRPGVKNIIGYITTILTTGYTPPVSGSAPAPSPEPEQKPAVGENHGLPDWVANQGKPRPVVLDPEQKRQAEELLRALEELEVRYE